MKKYRVDYTITSTYRIDVEARSEDEARSMLEDGADIDLGDTVFWNRFGGRNDDL